MKNFPKSCGNYRFGDGFMFHYGSVLFSNWQLFFGGGPRSFWSCRAFFRSCYLRYQANPPITVSLGCPGVCSYRVFCPTGLREVYILREGIFALN